MRQNLLVSNRGQMTLPASVRKRSGIQSGGVVTLEEKDKAAHLLTGDIKDFGTVMNNASLTGGVVIQTASEFSEGFLESRSKKKSGEKSDAGDIHIHNLDAQPDEIGMGKILPADQG